MVAEARIVILNYNGKKMLEQCLPSVREAVGCARAKTLVTVLDNQSSDQSEVYVRANFPEMEFVKAPENRVLCSYNDYLRGVPEPLVILLNNDLRVASDFIDPMVEKFREDPGTFLVAPRIHSFDGKSVEGVDTRAGIRCGMFWCTSRYPGYEAHTMVPSRTVSSGFGAFDRKKFLGLGGYDERYLPGIFEDMDLCLKAQRAGHQLYYEPRSLVYHMGQASFKEAFSDLRRSAIAYRNTFLFMWKNFRGFLFWAEHLFFLPPRMLWMLLTGRAGFIIGFWQAVSRTLAENRAEKIARTS